METLYVLILILNPVLADGSYGPDESFAIDGGLTAEDCMTENYKRMLHLHDVFAPEMLATLVCEPDDAPHTWGK